MDKIDPKLQNVIDRVKPIEIRAELFKQGNFDFIVKGTAINNELVPKGEVTKHLKQEQALKILTSHKYKEFLYGGAAGGAKGIPENGKVLTPFGFKEIKTLKVGSNICATDGTIQRIIARYDNGIIPFYRLTFADGTKIDCDYSHLWLAWKNRRGRKIKNERTFGEISAMKYTTEFMYEDFKKNGTNYAIPLTEPVRFNVAGSLYGAGNFVKRDLDPYTLGVLLGDGCLRGGVSFYSPDEQIAERISKKYDLSYYEAKEGQGNYNFVSSKGKEVKDYLTTIGLYDKYSHEKFIPKIYLHGSIEERWELLNGLMDTDGYADEDGDSFYSTASAQLSEDITYLARSLGCFVTSTVDENPYYRDENNEKVFCKASYRVRIKCKTPEKLFYLKRKKDRVKDKEHQSYGNKIVNIEKIENKKSICITVSNPNSLFITDNFIVTHNSWTGVSWIMFMAICYPGTKWFIAREELKDIIDSVLVTWGKVAKEYGFHDWKYNAVKNFIQLGNGSHINLIEIKYKPSDPNFDDLGSTEYTGGWIEEVAQTHPKAATTLRSRVGRHMNEKYGIKGIVFYTCNPTKNWAKSKFYDKALNETLESNKAFLQCLVIENPFIEQEYIDDLREMALDDNAAYERLFKGNWEYDDNPNKLCEQEMIEQVFDNDHVGEQGHYYITADAARMGSDKAVIFVWKGWKVVDVKTYDVSKTTEISYTIEQFRRKYRIPKNRVVVDSDGVGGGVADQTGAIGFKNNGTPIKEAHGAKNREQPNYKNLQVQCLYHLADKINEGALWIACDLSSDEKEKIKAELGQIQSKLSDVGKLDCKPKSEIKQDIGRSPDYRDALFMRVYFDLKPQRRLLAYSRPRTHI